MQAPALNGILHKENKPVKDLLVSFLFPGQQHVLCNALHPTLSAIVYHLEIAKHIVLLASQKKGCIVSK